MGESKRVTPETRAARAASAQAAAVDATRDRQRKACDALVHAGRHHMRGMSPQHMAKVLGTAVGIFALSAPGAERAFASHVDEVARDVLEQAAEAA